MATATTAPVRIKVPTHLWVVGAISLFWNAFQAVDYVLSQIRFPDYIAALTPEHLVLLEATSAWVTAAWALGVWGSVLGSVLLLLRSKWAVEAFGVSVLGFLIYGAYMYLLADALIVMGLGHLIFSLVIFFVALALFVYARGMRLRGVIA
jgi:hypothetical protein